MKKIRLFTILVFGILPSGYIMGQQNPSDLWMNPGTDDFATIRQNVENYYADKDKTAKGSGYKQWKRWEYIQQDRLTDDGKLMNYAAKNFQEYQDFAGQYGSRGITTTYGEWEPLGPEYFVDGNGWNPGIGRVNCFASIPAGIIWVGCPAGGLWRNDNGNGWVPLTDGMPRIGVSGFVVNPTNVDNMYLLSGDGDGGDVPSIGVLQTWDGGVTWTESGLTWTVSDLVYAYKILMHPTFPNVMFVVSSEGIHKTTNFGISWTLVHSASTFNYHDIEFQPGSSLAVMYACAGSDFFRSTDGGDTWNQIFSGVPTTATRMAIGIGGNVNFVYLLAGPSYSAGTFVGLFRSTDAGLNFTTRSTTPNILGYSAIGNDDDDQTTYDLNIAVGGVGEDIIIGAINCWQSNNGGTTWTLSSLWNNPPGTDYTHADIHALEFGAFGSNLYCGSDGGIFMSSDFGINWNDLSNGLAITQNYRIAGFEPNVDLIINGTQDNGSNRWNGGTTMLHVLGADGMDCMIDHSNSAIFYNSIQFGDLRRSLNSGATYSSIKPLASSGSWITPIVMHVTNPSIIYGGYSDIYRSTNGGTSWTNLGQDGSGAMALGGASHPDRVYASIDNSNVIVTSASGIAPFTNVTTNLPAGNITFIAVNPLNGSDVFVTYGGYSAGNKVFRSTNAGASWDNISGTLPNIPVNCIAYENTGGSPNDPLYIGTDLGIYYRDDGTADWIPFMNGLPATIVFDLEINESADVITAATYGRGLWRSELYSDCPTSHSLTVANDPSNPLYTGFQHYEASGTITSSRIITGGIGTDVTYQAGTSVTLLPGFQVKQDNEFKATLGACNGTMPTCGFPLIINHVAGSVAPVNKTVTYNTTDNIPGEPLKCWITSNLGADQQATAKDDATEASAGWYWQFNLTQGYKHDGTTRTPNTTWITSINENFDWQPGNDPCSIELGTGWRLPTMTEWTNVDVGGNWLDWDDAWNSALKMHGAGTLGVIDGSLLSRGSHGQYWSSTQFNNSVGWRLTFAVLLSGVGTVNKVAGFPVRCLKD